MGSYKKDLKGNVYGKLTVIEDAGKNKDGKYLWHCICECGNTKTALSQPLQDGRTTSCGCVFKERLLSRITTHGLTKVHAKHYLYNTWVSMRQRCNNPNSPNYNRYGGRGIKVCNAWNNSFEQFLSDMGARPSLKHSIDRIDNDGNYEPSNCRWATLEIQARNKRSSIWLEDKGLRMISADWAKKIGISQQYLRVLLRTNKLPQILTKYHINE